MNIHQLISNNAILKPNAMNVSYFLKEFEHPRTLSITADEFRNFRSKILNIYANSNTINDSSKRETYHILWSLDIKKLYNICTGKLDTFAQKDFLFIEDCIHFLNTDICEFIVDNHATLADDGSLSFTDLMKYLTSNTVIIIDEHSSVVNDNDDEEHMIVIDDDTDEDYEYDDNEDDDEEYKLPEMKHKQNHKKIKSAKVSMIEQKNGHESVEQSSMIYKRCEKQSKVVTKKYIDVEQNAVIGMFPTAGQVFRLNNEMDDKKKSASCDRNEQLIEKQQEREKESSFSVIDLMSDDDSDEESSFL